MNPERVVFDAFRPFMFPGQATDLAHTAVIALRAAGLLKECAGACVPTAEEEFAATGERINAMPLEDFNALCEELYERGEGGV